MSDYQTSQILLVAARGPGENARRIANGAHKIIGFQGSNPSLAAFGVGVDSKMIVIKGRILPAPSLTLREGDHEISIIPTAASWNLLNKQLATPVPVTDWSFLTLGGARLEEAQFDKFRGALKNCGLGEKVPLKPQGFHAPLPGSEEANDTAIQKVFKAMSEAKVKIVLVILPFKSNATYARVKYWGDVRTGIHSVCVLAKNLNQGLTYYANVALKFNLKCGGVNQLLPKQLGFLNEGRTMVVGIDVTHPAPKSMIGYPSIAAMVASIDSHYGRKSSPAHFFCSSRLRAPKRCLDAPVLPPNG